MEWTRWIDFLLSGTGGLIGATLGAFWQNHYAEKGKNWATYKDIEFLLAQERGKAYEQERGKRLATHEDIESVIREVKAVTQETETIKSQIGNELWTHQMVWHQKREAYFTLLKRCHNLQNALINFLVFCEKPISVTDLLAIQLNLQNDLVEAQRQFLMGIIESYLFVGPEVTTYLEDFKCRGLKINVEALEAISSKGNREELTYLSTWLANLITLAKKDLGLETQSLLPAPLRTVGTD